MNSMEFLKPHIRKNILTGEEVLVSPHRTKRPWQGRKEAQQTVSSKKYDEACYLCSGNERAGGKKNDIYVDIYVFENDFAALNSSTSLNKTKDGLLEYKTEKGICKVICFSPIHNLTLAQMSVDAIEKVVFTWKREFIDLAQLDYVNYIQIFENKGEIMGCSNPHPHGQIWAQNSIPKLIRQKTKNFNAHFLKNNRSLLLDYLDQELSVNQRVIYENDCYVVLIPFWAVWPYESMIIPKKCDLNISRLSKKETKLFAQAIKVITSIYDAIFETSFPYASGIHQILGGEEEASGWHWHMSFYPPLLRSASIKKFMVGYEMFAMPQRDVLPEEAAVTMKNILKKIRV